MDYKLQTEFPAKERETPLKTVLIIDDDLGFVFWLGHSLDAISYSALPARSVPDAALLVMQLDLKVDVLVVNPRLAGAPDFMAALRRSQMDVKVIGILSDPRPVPHMMGIHATRPKPTTFDEVARNEWLECIECFLTSATSAH